MAVIHTAKSRYMNHTLTKRSPYCQFERIDGRCKEIYQMNCVKKCYNPEECPEGKCFDILTRMFHDHHVHDRETGCPTCCCCGYVACPCGTNRCELDDEGCPTSKCLRQVRHQCPSKRFCPRNCESGQGGYRLDSMGCPTCDCVDSFEKHLGEIYGIGK